MADSPPDPASNENVDEGARQGPGPANRPNMPGWVKVSLIIVAVLIVVFVVLNLTGIGGQHGPSRHLPGGGNAPAQHTP